MENSRIIEEIRKLQKEFGEDKAEIIMNFIVSYQQAINEKFATKQDIANLAWKMAGLLIAQSAVIITLLKVL